MGLRALSVGVLVVALAIAVGKHQGVIQSAHLQGVLQQPAVARAVDRLRSLPLVQRLYGPAPGCSCGVSVAWVPQWLAALCSVHTRGISEVLLAGSASEWQPLPLEALLGWHPFRMLPMPACLPAAECH